LTATVRRTTASGFDSITIENSRVKAVVIPALGGRLWELTDLNPERQWIWHRDRVALAASPLGSPYDDVWAGGWEELFPNDAPGVFEGRDLPDHGEWWTTAWSVKDTSEGEQAVVRLAGEMRIRRTSCIKEFRLGGDSDTLQISYRIENLEGEGFHFLFKPHLAVAITPHCELVLPGGMVTVVDPGFGTILAAGDPFEWPLGRGADRRERDLRRIPSASSEEREFVYLSGLPAGWCGIDDVEAGTTLRLRFDIRDLPYLWLFLSYGGWRDCYTAVLEPCTNMPKDLAQAVRAGRSAYLPPHAVFQTSLFVTLGARPSGEEARA
jgi:hypothetical protein